MNKMIKIIDYLLRLSFMLMLFMLSASLVSLCI